MQRFAFSVPAVGAFQVEEHEYLALVTYERRFLYRGRAGVRSRSASLEALRDRLPQAVGLIRDLRESLLYDGVFTHAFQRRRGWTDAQMEAAGASLNVPQTIRAMSALLLAASPSAASPPPPQDRP